MLRALVLLFLFGWSSAYLYSYNNEVLKLGHLEYRRVGIFTKQDAPAVGPPGNGESYIDVDLELTRDDEHMNRVGIVQLVVAHSSTFDFIGHVDEQSKRHFCCTQYLINSNIPGCSLLQQGKVIASPFAVPEIQVKDVTWVSVSPTERVAHRFPITQSGRYYLLFSSCLNSTGDVKMSGKIEWMNPYGYLPGEIYYFVPLFRFLILGYVILASVWGAMCVMMRHDLMTLQHYVSVVIALGLIESITWYFDYQLFNNTGLRAVGPVLFAMLLSNIKRTLSRLLVLIVCMGYGVMKPSLGFDQRNKVIALGLIYAISSSIHDVMSAHSQMTLLMQHIRAFFLFPVAALDSLFFLWTLQEISSNIQQLTSRHQEAKLRVYQRFWYILLTTAVFSVAWAVYQVFNTMGSNEDIRWTTLWTFEGMWHIIYFVVLVAIAILWRPSANATAYAFSEQLAVDGDEDGLELTANTISRTSDTTFADDDQDHDHQ
eukprot:c3466_g1_i1.p1 GENE.c3466_g1_i1~~c3466_g1_i1.p1  ORF type:complete len:485 (-),score=106.83 c3466_g1_i1:92-1546(-)